jgi:hypothetical protein
VKILFDQGTPVPLRQHLVSHAVTTTYEQGWSDLTNGQLFDAAEQAGYQLIVTTDQNLKYQQNLAGRRLAVVVLLSTSWPRIRLRIDEIRMVVDDVAPGEYREIPV